MDNVAITNNDFRSLKVDYPDTNITSNIISQGETRALKNWGRHNICAEEVGEINLTHPAEDKLSQYSPLPLSWTQQELGDLICYRGLDAYFRYKDDTTTEAIVAPYGCFIWNSKKVHDC